MKTHACILATLMLVGTKAYAQDGLNLEAYRCGEFLQDASRPASASRLIRPMMMIAWASGYAAAHSSNEKRADSKALELMSGVIGQACRKQPSEPVKGVAVSAIDQFVSTEHKK